MTKIDLSISLPDHDESSPGDWELKLSAFEAIRDRGLVVATILDDESGETSPAVYVEIEQLRAALDRIEAALPVLTDGYQRGGDIPPSSPGLSVVE